MHIRAARRGEAAALTGLARESKAHWGYSAEALAAWAEELAIREADIAARPAFVAEVDGEAAGFYALVPADGPWEIDHFWVRPPFMRRGIGRALLSHALERAGRGGAATVTVDADPNAAAFYLACGAERQGEIAAPLPGDPGRVRPQLRFRVHAAVP